MSFSSSSRASHDPSSLPGHHAAPSSTTVAYVVILIVFIYYLLQYLNCMSLPLPELLWNSVVTVTPMQIVSFFDRGFQAGRQGDYDNMTLAPSSHANKSNAMRRILGLDGAGIMGTVQRTRTLPKINNAFRAQVNNNLPGLGNWDNSCYQNSVLQGLASLEWLPAFLDGVTHSRVNQPTKSALKITIERLNDPNNAGKTFWTPGELKSMSSWQQQDAQEYFSKISDELEKDTAKEFIMHSSLVGLEILSSMDQVAKHSSLPNCIKEPRKENVDTTTTRSNLSQMPEELVFCITRNPLEGLLAQRVGCQRCGFVEGLSMVPFNCLTVPLGRGWLYDVRSCLDDYTALEPINGVECAKCTLQHVKKSIEQVLHSTQHHHSTKEGLAAAESLNGLKVSLNERLLLVEKALDDEDFSDQALQRCQVSPKNRVTTTKSRQAVIARAPKSLVIHVNRSNFDELTGTQSKNLANVRFPFELDLAPWCLGNAVKSNGDVEGWNTNPSESMLPNGNAASSGSISGYKLRAVITHYGRHENGHYICYRKSPRSTKLDDKITHNNTETWWRLSDEDVTEVEEDFVLSQGGVFMLFYEQPNPLQHQLVPSRHDAVNVDSWTQETAEIDRASVFKMNSLPKEVLEHAPNAWSGLPTPPSTPKLSGSKEELLNPSETSQTTSANTTSNIAPPPETLELPPPAAQFKSVTSSISPEDVFKKASTESPHQQPSSRMAKENHPVSPTSMRTAAPRSGRGSVSRAGKAMGSVAGFVQAN